MGKLYDSGGTAVFRRWLLRRSRFHIYYLFDEAAGVIVIASIWNATRGHGPPLI